VLVIAVLHVFLADWRTALISSIAIPLSLLAAGLLLHYRGGTLDTMVLAGLVIALGEVVDDAIIDVENIVRRLRLNREQEVPRTALAVVLDASLEVRSAVVYGSVIVVLVFIPVFLLPGLTGAFFRPLPFALVGAIVATLLTGGVLSLGSLVGLVTVVGIAARNGIMLVSHFRHLELQEGMVFGCDLVLCRL
jgi:Cu/Ag efflux pump CusA